MKIKLALATALLSAPLFVAAEPQQVPCPSADLIKTTAAYLDTVQVLNKQDKDKVFEVFSFTTAYDEASKRWWGTQSEVATYDFNNAFATGVANVQNIVKSAEQYAKHYPGIGYACTYLDSNQVSTVQAFTEEENVAMRARLHKRS